MKKKLLLVLTIALAILTLFAFSSCGKNDESGSESVSESDITGSDSQQTSVVDTKGDGTKENPYLIKTADDLLDFADRINNYDDDDDDYASSFFRLENDIDMAGEKYYAAGKPVTVENDDGTTVIEGGFRGSFNGNGHKITNLTITQTLRMSVGYVGLFGYTNKANIFDLTIENLDYEIESYSSEETVGAYIGGAVGYAVLTNFVNVKTSGTIETKFMDKNLGYIGGIAGELEVYDKNQSYIAYVRNCSAAVETAVGKFEGGESSVLENAANGGIIGRVNCSKGAVSIINCVSNGKVYGGEYVGGIVGYSSGSNVSIINCVNYANVRATSKEVSYAGGIVGSARSDMIVLDSYSAGGITGVKATSSSYKSYAGGIFGYSCGDDYEMGYTAGVAAENDFCSGAVKTYDVLNKTGTKIDKSTTVNKDWFVNALGFDKDEWDYADGKIAPKDYDKSSGSYKLSLYADDKLVKEIDKPYDEEGFAFIGELEDAENDGTDIFFDWIWTTGSTRYRYYVPVVKDIRLDAQYGDVSALTGTYKGTYEYYGVSDAGVLVLNNDGSLQWINSGVIGGKYKTDGTHVLFTFNNEYGDVTGSYSDADETVGFTIEHGMSATVDYTFTKASIRVFGQYFNDAGDMFAFTDKKLTLYSDSLNSNYGISGTYTINGDELSVSGEALAKYFSSMKITINADDSLAVKFVGTDYSLDCNFARPKNTDHTGKKYVGKYSLAYLYSSSNGPYQSDYTMEFSADGSFYRHSKYSTTTGSFYVFEGNIVKILLEGNISTMRYDESNDIFFGLYSAGTSAKKNVVLTPVEDGALKAFMIGNDENTYVAVTDKKQYVVTNGELNLSATVVAPDGFADGARISIDGVSYRVVYYSTEQGSQGYGLTVIGPEEGEYSYNGKKVVIDGIGNVSGEKNGSYAVFDDNLVVIVYDDDEILGFDYAAAKSDGGKITAKTPDKYQGVWYKEKLDNQTDPENPVMKKYNKLIIDGFGHATYLYNRDFEGEWIFNWGGKNQWRTVTETATGLYCRFNEYNEVEIYFYYNGQLAYCKSSGNFGEQKLVSDGYAGTTDIPSLPSGVAGTYNGTESGGTAIVFNLKQDLTGSIKGVPFSAIYDGIDKVAFTANKVDYLFTISAKTLTYGTESVVLTRGGDVEEVIPAMFVGTWSGNFTGYNAGTRTIKIESDGTMTLNDVVLTSEYNAEKSQIIGKNSDETYVITLTWNSETNVLSAKLRVVRDGDIYDLECSSLTKA